MPLNYTTGNIYENDSGVPLPPMPSLKLIDDLIRTPVGSSDAYDIMTALNHKRNFVLDSFERAIELTDRYMDGLAEEV